MVSESGAAGEKILDDPATKISMQISLLTQQEMAHWAICQAQNTALEVSQKQNSLSLTHRKRQIGMLWETPSFLRRLTEGIP